MIDGQKRSSGVGAAAALGYASDTYRLLINVYFKNGPFLPCRRL